MRILLHICCAPCALMPVEVLRDEGHELMGLFYNPNIQPYQEHQRRLACLEPWAADEGLKLVVHGDYDPEAWFRRTAFREAMRCNLCHHDRMTRAAQVARKGGFDGFTSTLLYSVRQKHDSVAEAGRAAAARYGVEFVYRDFRPLWKPGVARSLELEMYRQQYCGCLYSERDRFQRPSDAGADAK